MRYCYLRLYTAEGRPRKELLLDILGIFHMAHISFQPHKTGENCLKIVTLVVFFNFCYHFECLK